MTTYKKIRIAVLGASGYIGLELLQRLVKHPKVELVFLGSEHHVGKYPAILFPPLRRHELFHKIKFDSVDKMVESDVVISALPVGILPNLVSSILLKTNKIINVSGDFRLTDAKEIAKYYPPFVLNKSMP